MSEWRAGDTVVHIPSGEKWRVAYVCGDRLAWYGWPEGECLTGQCVRVRECTDAEHRAALEKWAGSNARTDSGRLDIRVIECRRQLEALNQAYVGMGL